ncbi:T9SS type A sorting domain-containing protein [Aequorivita lipolytica]|uniref:T9SS type A sorting domain-containing protein n=1 Tax=Aequorivita lipolytica TaxID=153267 RepID=A0A5C6YTQ1_9FLAO|nr:T9SS type A sorting domain-containing protein [Aequorivita lipolytica]TXD70659.1 T9SS type A sorting domain-containing protein [Aequorivita lipolytica]SRX49694.1 hypothetical protein AEQU2_00157 [Aequorivita lipolytica]
MMKYLLLLVPLVFFNGYSQFGPQQIISTEAELPVQVFTADIDGDGKLDILSAARFKNNIAWYRNMDGNGTFSSLNLIGLLSETKAIYAADLDNDGDTDVLGVSSSLDRVVWYENLDGLGNFGPEIGIAGNADGGFSVIAADLDGDGDNDVVSASDNSGLAWHENLDGSGDFSFRKIIDDNILSSRSVVAADLDGDGDLDLVGNGYAPGVARIFWYENLDGLGNFGPFRVIRDFSVYANMLFVADADADGDMDVFSASNGDDEVAWHENLDGLGNFGPKNIITNSLPTAFAVYVADLDNDNDMDVLATGVETFSGEVVWFENLDGLGSFGGKQTITTEVQSPRSVIAADIDNDGDMDVIGSSQNDNKIAWYENYTILGVGENETNNFKVYPNPVSTILNVQVETGTAITNIKLYDIFGRMLLKKEGEALQIDFSNYATGIYYLKLETNNGEQIFKVIKE